MPITNQRAADGRCDVRRSDVILLILCRSTCVHGALLTTLPPPPLSTRRNFGERSDAGVATREYVRARPMDSAGGWFQVARNQGSMLQDVASDRDRHPNTGSPSPHAPRWRNPLRPAIVRDSNAHVRWIPKREDLTRFDEQGKKLRGF